MPRKILALFGLLLVGCALPALAVAFGQTFSGTTNGGGPTWQRPSSLVAVSSNCTACRYSTQSFELTQASSCYLVAQQGYDGHVALYRGSFNPVAPLVNLVDLNDDGELGVGSSRIPDDFDDDQIVLAADPYVLVTSGFDNNDQGSFTNTLHCDSAQPTQGTCFFSDIPREKSVCLFDRFIVAIAGISNHPTDGVATPVRFGSKETTFFWFYGDQNFEVMLKVLDACAINNKWWVFAGALTNQAYHIVVHDLQTGTRRDYFNTQGTNAAAITDTNAFPCTP